MGYTRWTLQGLSGRKAGNLKEVGLGWINGGRKDRGFGWGTIRGGGEQLFWRPGGKNWIEQSEGVYFKGGTKKEELKSEGEQWFVILVVLPKGCCSQTLSALQKYGGWGNKTERPEGAWSEGRGYTTDGPPTHLLCWNDKSIDSGSARKIPMMLKALSPWL